MEELQRIYSTDPETTSISLSNFQINDLGELLPLLSQFKHMKALDLSNNSIDEFPQNLSSLSSLEALNINGNLLKDTYFTIECLASLPKLISLNINLNEEEQVDYIMNKLPELQILNDLQVERDEEEEEEEEDDDNERVLIQNEVSQSQQPPLEEMDNHINSIEPLEIPQPGVGPQQTHNESENIEENDSFGSSPQKDDDKSNIPLAELEKVAILYDSIRDLHKRKNPSKDQELARDFDHHLQRVMKNLYQSVKNSNVPETIKKVNGFKAKYDLYDI